MSEINSLRKNGNNISNTTSSKATLYGDGLIDLETKIMHSYDRLSNNAIESNKF